MEWVVLTPCPRAALDLAVHMSSLNLNFPSVLPPKGSK
jgi:hypothetical protein